jgi:hypothetical protein
MAATPSVKVLKTFSYKGNTKQWSNRYHFNGGTPADPTHWNTFFDAVVAAEKLCLGSNVTITECIGYNAGSDLPIASKVYSQVGSITLAGSEVWLAGVMVFLMKWSTTARTSKNHPIYLFSYIHGMKSDPSAGIGTVQSSQKSAINTYGAAWVTGFSDGSNTYVRAGPNGATGSYVTPPTPYYATHRDFRD